MEKMKNSFSEKKETVLQGMREKISFYAKKYPKEIFFTFFGLLAFSVFLTFFNLYTFEDREKKPMYVHPVNNIGDKLKEKEMQGLGGSLPTIQGLQNPISVYSKIEEIEILNQQLREINRKKNKTAQDSLKLIEIYTTLKKMSNE